MVVNFDAHITTSNVNFGSKCFCNSALLLGLFGEQEHFTVFEQMNTKRLFIDAVDFDSLLQVIIVQVAKTEPITI